MGRRVSACVFVVLQRPVNRIKGCSEKQNSNKTGKFCFETVGLIPTPSHGCQVGYEASVIKLVEPRSSRFSTDKIVFCFVCCFNYIKFSKFLMLQFKISFSSIFLFVFVFFCFFLCFFYSCLFFLMVGVPFLLFCVSLFFVFLLFFFLFLLDF